MADSIQIMLEAMEQINKVYSPGCLQWLEKEQQWLYFKIFKLEGEMDQMAKDKRPEQSEAFQQKVNEWKTAVEEGNTLFLASKGE